MSHDPNRSWIDDTRIIDHALSSRHELDVLARAFALTGNITVAKKLYDVSDQLEMASEVLRSMTGKVAYEGMERAREGTRNVLTMAMLVVDPKNDSGLRDVLPKMIP